MHKINPNVQFFVISIGNIFFVSGKYIPLHSKNKKVNLLIN